ncbi:hypothetical protein O9K51_11390 [Purpureocillium lavendulum]|uniref:Uncharacterized protein n=1 Tax=Purpureocillium lavendulum TaxID=1247861 RepID=A0AB34FB73_9HYPO|nr:hypothetical protein O9K51_11390 [Purpureocillium lavendulum]
MTLDMISSVAFGMDSSKASLKREVEAIQQYGNKFRISKEGSIQFPPAPTDRDNEALFDIAKMISIAQGSPLPTLAQWLALLNPFNLEHSRAFFRRRSLLQQQTALSLHRLTSVDEQTTPKSALEYLLRREQTAAESAARAPEYYSPAIRDEVCALVDP